MPQFVLNEDKTIARAIGQTISFHAFMHGYIVAMFFTNGDTGNEERPDHLNELGTSRLTREALNDIEKDCSAFWVANLSVLEKAFAYDYDPEQAGHDFWLTRQGHGAGFFDRDELNVLHESERDSLIDNARKFGEAYVEVYRGWIYHR